MTGESTQDSESHSLSIPSASRINFRLFQYVVLVRNWSNCSLASAGPSLAIDKSSMFNRPAVLGGLRRSVWRSVRHKPDEVFWISRQTDLRTPDRLRRSDVFFFIERFKHSSQHASVICILAQETRRAYLAPISVLAAPGAPNYLIRQFWM
jgi:hypothetical protein